MRLLTPPILLCSMAVGTATAQQPVWLDHFGNGSTGNGSFILAGDETNALYALGLFAGPPMVVGSDTLDQLGTRDILLLKLDTSGSVVWARTAGGACVPEDNERRTSIAVDPSADRLLITGVQNCPLIYFGSCSVGFP